MTQILQFLLTVAAIVLIAGLCNQLYRRIYLVRVIKRISSIEGVSASWLKNPFISLVRLSDTPEIAVKIYDDCYLIRLYNGGGGGNAVHFATEKFTVCYSRIKIKNAVYTPKRGRLFTLSGFNVGARVKVMPDLVIPDELNTSKYTEVLLFNPAPTEVSYVVKEKTSIKVAFTGDEIFGRRIFTTSTFEIFVDREARRIKNEQSTKI
jgi:hypothetical protein